MTDQSTEPTSSHITIRLAGAQSVHCWDMWACDDPERAHHHCVRFTLEGGGDLSLHFDSRGIGDLYVALRRYLGELGREGLTREEARLALEREGAK